MSRDAVLRLTHDPEAGSIAADLAASAALGVPVVLTDRALRALARELGGPEAAGRFLLELANASGKPIAVNLETGPETSRTWTLPPAGWSGDKLLGWTGGMGPHLERAFGPVVPPNRGERRRRQRERRR